MISGLIRLACNEAAWFMLAALIADPALLSGGDKLMGLLSKQDILKADDRPVEEVSVPEWGGTVLVRGLDGEGRDEFFASMAVIRDPRKPPSLDTANSTAKLVARCILDPDDPERERLMFTQQEVAALGRKSGAALNRVNEVVQRLSGLSEEDMAELGKGSASTPSDGSTSAPPPPSDAPSPSYSGESPPAS